MAARTGAELLVDVLLAQGATDIFGVPGESYLAVLDALYPVGNRLRFTVCRQEGGAAYMAAAAGELTGRPGIAMVTRGPGATNAAIGVHLAHQDSLPMILFVGQVARRDRDREAFQEVDYRAFFTPLAKWATEIDDPARVPELVTRAFRVAMSGRPGPVVIGLPEDMLAETVNDPPPIPPYATAPAQAPTAADMAQLRALMETATRPFLLVGGAAWTPAAKAGIEAFAQANGLPVGVSFRAQDSIDNDHPCYAGHVGIGPDPLLADRVRDADLLIAVGCRLGEMTTGGYTLVTPPVPTQKLVHVYPQAEELGRVFAPTLAIAATPEAFGEAAASLDPIVAPAWAGQAAEAHAAYLAHSQPVETVGPVQPAAMMAHLRACLPDDAIATCGAGNYAIWFQRFFAWRRMSTQLAPTAGSMGYGVPAAIAAKRLYPDRPVVSVNGDGCFSMNGQELATAAQYGLPIVFLVFDNGMYGTIRMHQEREYPGRVSGTQLTNPDYAALGRAHGGLGFTVDRTEDFAPALAEALAADRLSVIHIKTDPEAITPNRTLSQIRAG